MTQQTDWFDPSTFIKNSNRITDVFGYWPSFHDAEIQSLTLSVGGANPWETGPESPMLNLLVHVFEMTKELDDQGYFILTKHTLADLRFLNVEGLSLSAFSYQNCIFDLSFGLEPMTYPYGGGPVEGPPPNLLTVKCESSVGLFGEFKCLSAEILSAIPCDEDGRPLHPTA